ncbi:AI-2E family transporter [Halobacteriales archaeon QS_1_68_20]|nr:MAG: AI-2E family transporter [Halobacteriales archaeon QS_1_68_20]
MDSSPATRREKVAWGLMGAVVTLVVAYVLWAFVGAIVVAIFLYYATRPVYRRLDARVSHPDWNATATLMLVGVPLLAVIGYGVLVGVQELDQFLSGADLQGYRSVLQPYVDVAELTDPGNLLGRVRDRLPGLLAVVTAAFFWVFRLFVIFLVAFYLLRDDRKIAGWFRDSLGDDHDVVVFLEGVDEDLAEIYVGNLATIGATTAIAVVTYYALNLVAPSGISIAYPFLLGLLTGVGTLIPAVGMKLIYVPYGALLLWQSVSGGGPLWFPVAFFVATFLVVDTVPDFFVRSYLSSGSISMGLMLIAYTFTPVAVGWYGIFLAPILAVLFVHFARYVFPNLVGDGAGGLVADGE